jgi:hypothetical protein
VARAHDAEGWTLEWVMPAAARTRFACDVEAPLREGALRLPEVLGGWTSFRESWVLAEVAAKLLDIPILEWLHLHRSGRTPGLPDGARALVVTGTVGDRTLAFGWTPVDGPPGDKTRPDETISHLGFGFGRVVVRHERHPGEAPCATALTEVL